MKLIFDDYEDCWVWVSNRNHDLELSPRFDEESFALQWRGRVSEELQVDLDRLYTGDSVVLPKSIEHAESMVRVGMFYLDQHNGKRTDNPQ